jgi:hypothetical protein
MQLPRFRRKASDRQDLQVFPLCGDRASADRVRTNLKQRSSFRLPAPCVTRWSVTGRRQQIDPARPSACGHPKRAPLASAEIAGPGLRETSASFKTPIPVRNRARRLAGQDGPMDRQLGPFRCRLRPTAVQGPLRSAPLSVRCAQASGERPAPAISSRCLLPRGSLASRDAVACLC